CRKIFLDARQTGHRILPAMRSNRSEPHPGGRAITNELTCHAHPRCHQSNRRYPAGGECRIRHSDRQISAHRGNPESATPETPTALAGKGVSVYPVFDSVTQYRSVSHAWQSLSTRFRKTVY